MIIAIPVDGIDAKKSEITKLLQVEKWALIDFDEGVAQSIEFYDNRTDFPATFVDFVILQNKFENYMEFMEEGSMVLVVREEEKIEDIIEAFKFKELDEVGY